MWAIKEVYMTSTLKGEHPSYNWDFSIACRSLGIRKKCFKGVLIHFDKNKLS